MSIPVPTAGQPTLDTWGQAVSQQLNRMIVLQMAADQSTNSASATNITDFAFPVVAGRIYTARLAGPYVVNATNQGLQMAYLGPGATSAMGYLRLTGNGSATGETAARMPENSLQGRTSTDATFSRYFWLDFRYVASHTGTLNIQFARGGSSGAPGVTIQAGAGGMVIESV